MPRRRHENKARSDRPLTVDELNLWCCSPVGVLAAFGSVEEAREEWRRRGHLLRTNPGTRPEAWWTLFAPAELHHPGGPVYLTAEDWERVNALEVARAEWMLAHPEHLRDEGDRAAFGDVVRRRPAPPWPGPDADGEVTG